MTFMIAMIALLVERFFDWSHLRNGCGYVHYQQFILKKVLLKKPYILLALMIIPVLCLLGLLEWLLSTPLYGFVEFVFQIVIVLYCLGPQNIWAEMTSSSSVMGDIFVEANQRVFAPLFWFACLGPCGIVLYRTVNLSSQCIEVSEQASFIQSILDWVPIRLTSLLFALSGNFVKVFSVFRKNYFLELEKNKVLLTQCGEAALMSDDRMMIDQTGKNVMELLDRTSIIWLAFIAMLMLIV